MPSKLIIVGPHLAGALHLVIIFVVCSPFSFLHVIIPSIPINLLASADILRKKFAKKSIIFRLAQDWFENEWRWRANHSGLPVGRGGRPGGQVGGWAGW